jgi:hypothetical protein
MCHVFSTNLVKFTARKPKIIVNLERREYFPLSLEVNIALHS